MSSLKKVNVTIDGEIRETELGTKLSELFVAQLPCGGHGKCGKCKVLARGELSPLSDTEKEWLSDEETARGVRLACCTAVEGECIVEKLWEENAGERILLGGSDSPTVSAASSAPAFEKYGAAIDIGTTTLAAQLYDVSGVLLSECGRLNPQSVWGADVISRIEAALKGDLDLLRDTILAAIDEILSELSEAAGMSASDIDGIVLTGNTAMLHFLTATSPEPLSHAPFEAERLFGETIAAGELGLNSTAPQTEVYLPNCIAAFVGADTVCALLATDLCGGDDTAMLVDIGTNGEIAMWDKGKLAVCSTAAGPAFEGVGISMGMRGATGAVDRVELKNGELSAHVIDGVQPQGICGSGLVDAIACLLENETLDETGYLEDDPVEIAPPVVLTQEDIRMVQLAKSAICAGIRTLLNESESSYEGVKKLSVAGGFGSYLNMENAGKIGLLPPELTDRIKVEGNAALAGAAMLLHDKTLRVKAAELIKSAEVVDLSTNPFFAESYMSGMLFGEF